MFDATPMLRGYAALRAIELAASDPVSVQQSTLTQLVLRAEKTQFGKQHGFSDVATVREFQKRVPLRRYEDFFREYWQPAFPRLTDCTWPGLIPYFALSSGTTTGKTKFIPCSRDTLFANWRGAQDVLVHHVSNRPWSQVLGGKCLVIGGSTALKQEAEDVWSGDLSGIETCEVPWWQRPWVVPPRELALSPDWESKIELIAQLAVHEDVRVITGAPNWLLLFFEKLFASRPDHDGLVTLFPNLELIIHGGINFGPYRRKFEALLQGSHAETREVYAASEGFIAVADRGDGDGLRLSLDSGIFFEFLPVDELESARPTRHWIADVEMGVEYAVVVSTCSGLWAYSLGDTVRFTGRSPPRIMITGRTSYVLSAVGEHVIAEEIEEAVRTASAAAGLYVNDYSAGCISTGSSGTAPRHTYIVEFGDGLPEARAREQFGHVLDDTLRNSNDDYASHRAHDFSLKPPVVVAVRPGTFARWMKERGKLGGQHKVPRIINDAGLFAELMSFIANTDDGS